MKAVLRKQHFKIAALALVALVAGANTPAHADDTTTGKTGTTIVFSKNTAQGLYGSSASNETKANQWFAFLRHNIAHVQIQSSNYPKLNTNGSGAFADNHNDMLFNSEGELRVTNYHAGSYDQVCLAVIAPKGYRFTRYQWEVDKATLTSNASKEVNTCSLCEFTYDANGNIAPKADSLKITQSLDKWDVTLANGSNVLYFRLSTGVKNQVDVFFKSLKLTYDIDQPFASQLPNSDATSTFHSGLLDFGTFSNNNKGAGYNVYQDANLNDLQEVSLYSKSTTEGSTVSKVTSPETVTVDDNQYYVAAQNGDYYMEAPAKFRIVGATLNFRKYDKTEDVSSITSGSAYVITDGDGHYLNNNNGTISVGTSASEATQWTVTKSSSSSSSSSYTIKNGDYYLALNSLNALTLSESSDTWSWSSSNGFYQRSGRYYYYYYYYDTTNSKWTVGSSSLNYSNSYTNKLQSVTIGGSFTANAYLANDNNTTSEDGVTVNSSNASATITLSDYNNDAIHFQISGLAEGATALYNVNLQLMPLNPEIQNITVNSAVTSGDKTVTHATTTTSEDFTFSNGSEDYVTVIVPKDYENADATVTFSGAYNESQGKWYTNGENANNANGGYSNYFLVNSTADNGTGDNVSLDLTKTTYPTDRTSATQAGTVGLTSTNIADVAAGKDHQLKDTEFKKSDAKYSNVTLSSTDTDAKTYYIYTADVPTYNILNGVGTQHIDFRYYKLAVKREVANETPKVEIVPLYTATLKGKNNKQSNIDADKSETLDENTTFFGAQVTAKASSGEARGYLTSADVVSAIKEAVKAEAEKDGSTFKYSSDDALRGMLYLDMSSLKSVDVTAFDADFNNSTADNCLYFMHEGFSRDNVQNVIAKEGEKDYKAVSNIVVKDQQPFFAPHDFTTGTYTASYVRESTNGKALVKNMAVVLPFSISLDGEGHVKTASDNIDSTITYYNLTSQGELKNMNQGQGAGLTYGAKMTAITDGTASANKPYYVQKSDDAEAGFSYTITDAKFVATPALNTVDNSEHLTNQASDDAWKAVGTYAGVTPTNDNTKWYFAKEMLWKSGALKNSKKFNVLPFRAYFVDEAATTEDVKQAKIVFSDDDIVTNGISNVNAENNGLTIAAANGAIMISADANTRYAVYTAAGQMVACGTLAAGESRTVKAQQGLYIVNNVKTIVK